MSRSVSRLREARDSLLLAVRDKSPHRTRRAVELAAAVTDHLEALADLLDEPAGEGADVVDLAERRRG